MDEESKMKTRTLLQPYDNVVGTKMTKTAPRSCNTEPLSGITLCNTKNGTTAKKKMLPLILIFGGLTILVIMMSLSVTVVIDDTITPSPPFVSSFFSILLVPLSIGMGIVIGKMVKG